VIHLGRCRRNFHIPATNVLQSFSSARHGYSPLAAGSSPGLSSPVLNQPWKPYQLALLGVKSVRAARRSRAQPIRGTQPESGLGPIPAKLGRGVCLGCTQWCWGEIYPEQVRARRWSAGRRRKQATVVTLLFAECQQVGACRAATNSCSIYQPSQIRDLIPPAYSNLVQTGAGTNAEVLAIRSSIAFRHRRVTPDGKHFLDLGSDYGARDRLDIDGCREYV
jgi:hypothetical protein